MGKREAGALIIRNFKLMESATKLLHWTVEKEIFAAVSELCAHWVNTQDWAGEFNWWTDSLWFAPKDWLRRQYAAKQVGRRKKQEAFAWFDFTVREGDDWGDSEKSDWYYLTRLCSVGENQIGFAWMPDETELRITGNKAEWRAFAQSQANAFIDRGFVIEEKTARFFLPVQVSNERLAAAYEVDSITDALQPFVIALETLGSCADDFTKLIALARDRFASKEK
jgi:hypothetical protein